jgi:hypothetical protein
MHQKKEKKIDYSFIGFDFTLRRYKDEIDFSSKCRQEGRMTS